MWKTVLFDLDGTLTDSAEGITKCVQHALVTMGYEAPELEDLHCFVGPPLKEMFMEYTGMSEEDGEKAVAIYRERYAPIGIFENRLYPRIVKMLELFQKEGITMGVASSKPEAFVKQVLEHFGIDDYFKVIVGSEMGGARVQKKEVVEEAIRRLKMEKHKEQVVLVGDTKFDVEGAREAGIDCIGVTYGYGDPDELEASNPIYLAESVSDVAECVLSQHSKQKNETVGYKIWRILYPILLHLGMSTVIVYAVMAGMMIYQLAQTGTMDMIDIANTIIEQNSLLTAISCVLLIPIATWFFRKDEWKRKDQGLRNRLMASSKFGVKRVILLVVFFILYSILLNQLIEWSGLHRLFPYYSEAVATSLFESSTMLISYLAIVILAPISEELIYRGLVYRRLRDYLGVKWAIVMSALIFGIIHGNMVQFVFAFLIGLALAAVYERYRTIWAPIAAHMAVNLFSCAMDFAQIKLLPDWGMAVVLLFLAEGIVVAILGVITLKKWKPKKKEVIANEDTEEETA